MPVLKKEIELSDGKKIWVRQASGMEKLPIENIQAKVFRKTRHFGADPQNGLPNKMKNSPTCSMKQAVEWQTKYKHGFPTVSLSLPILTSTP